MEEGKNKGTKANVLGKVSGLKVTAKKRALHVSFKGVKRATKYEVAYSTNKKFKTKKRVTTKGTKVILKKLKPKKAYYVKVRAFIVSGGKKNYGTYGKTVAKRV